MYQVRNLDKLKKGRLPVCTTCVPGTCKAERKIERTLPYTTYLYYTLYFVHVILDSYRSGPRSTAVL
jgi:hypothetical protein